jgi:transcriptional regulator with XRE-family HTH domain
MEIREPKMTDQPAAKEASERQLLGERLRDARKYLGLNQEDVAAHLKIPRTALVDIESGQRRVEALELTRLAKLYKQPIGFFTGEDAAATLPASVMFLAKQAAELSDQDKAEVSRFVEYLRARSQADKD